MPSSERQHRIAEWSALRSLAQTLNQSFDLRVALDTALGHILELTGQEAGWIYLRNENDQFILAARQRLPRYSITPARSGKVNAPARKSVAAVRSTLNRR